MLKQNAGVEGQTMKAKESLAGALGRIKGEIHLELPVGDLLKLVSPQQRDDLSPLMNSGSGHVDCFGGSVHGAVMLNQICFSHARLILRSKAA